MPQGSLSGFHPPNINTTYHMLKDALEGAGEPSKSEGGLSIEPAPSQVEIGALLFRLIAKAPEKAAEALAKMGIGPEDFVAALSDHDAAEGLSFDVDEEKLATSMESVAAPESPVRQISEIIGGRREEESPVREIPEIGLPTGESAPPLALPAQAASPSASAPNLAIGDNPMEAMPPAHVAPPPMEDIPPERQLGQPGPFDEPTTPPAPGMGWAFDPQTGSWKQSPLLAAPEEGPAPTMGPGSPAAGGPPPQPEYDPLSGGSANTGLPPSEVAAAPVQQDALAEKANLANQLGAILEGVGQVGDPAVPEVATPSAPSGPGGIQRGQLLELLARAQQSNPSNALRLGQALSLGR